MQPTIPVRILKKPLFSYPRFTASLWTALSGASALLFGFPLIDQLVKYLGLDLASDASFIKKFLRYPSIAASYAVSLHVCIDVYRFYQWRRQHSANFALKEIRHREAERLLEETQTLTVLSATQTKDIVFNVWGRMVDYCSALQWLAVPVMLPAASLLFDGIPIQDPDTQDTIACILLVFSMVMSQRQAYSAYQNNQTEYRVVGRQLRLRFEPVSEADLDIPLAPSQTLSIMP